jgi:hypothetical protein
MELIILSFEGDGITPVAKIVERKSITGDTDQFIFSDKDVNLGPVDLLSTALVRPGYNRAKCIEQKDGYLIYSNLKSAPLGIYQEIANQISFRYNEKEIVYQDTVAPGDSNPIDNFVVDQVFFDSALDVETMVFRFSDEVDIENTNLIDIALVKVEVNAGVFVYTVINPTGLGTDVNAIGTSEVLAKFAGTDMTTLNFTDFSDIRTAGVPVYTWAVGTDIDTLTGLATGAADILSIDIAGNVPLGQGGQILYNTGTVDTDDTYGDATEVLLLNPTDGLAANPTIGLYDAAYLGIFNAASPDDGVTFVLNTPDNGSVALIPTIFSPGADIVEGDIGEETSAEGLGTAANNEGYFGDYKEERLTYDSKGYMRDEVYSLGIQLIFNTGARTPVFHIPGRDRTTTYNPTSLALNHTPADAGNKFLGTYISNSEYPLTGGYPLDTGSGFDYSAESKVRHHKMPNIDQSPTFVETFDSGGNVSGHIIRILGIQPVWEDGGVNKTISDLIRSFPGTENIKGFVIHREKRDKQANRYIDMQGVGQGLTRHAATVGDDKPCITNSYMFGKTLIDTSDDDKTKRVIGAHSAHDYIGWTPPQLDDNGDPVAGSYTDLTMCSFYSPDITLFRKSISDNSIVKPIAAIEGKIREVIRKEFYATKDPDRAGGALHLACSYNRFIPLSEVGVSPTDKRVRSSFFVPGNPSYDKNFISVTNRDDLVAARQVAVPSDFTSPSLLGWLVSPLVAGIRMSLGVSPTLSNEAATMKIMNYINEGFMFIDFGEGNKLDEINDPNPEVTYKLRIKKKGSVFTGKTWTEHLNISYPRVNDRGDAGISRRLLYNVYTENPALYGSVTSAEYIPVAEEFSLDNVETITDSIYYNGDTFISPFSFKNSNTWRWRGRYNDSNKVRVKSEGSGGKKYTDGFPKQYLKQNNPRTGDEPQGGEELRCMSQIFVESIVNSNYRHVPVEVDIETGLEKPGVDYYPHKVLTQGITPEALGVLDYNPLLGESDGYNELYSKENDILPQAPVPFGAEEVTEYPNRSIYSQKSIDGEQSDRYRFFPLDNFHDIPKNSGPINSTYVLNNIFWLHTENSPWRTFFNESTAIAGQNGNVYLGTGGLFPRPSIEVFPVDGGYAGTQSQWGGINTPFGRFYMDLKQKRAFLLHGETVQDISGGMGKWFQENIDLLINDLDNPFNPGDTVGLTCGYDYDYNRALITLHNRSGDEDRSFTISFSPEYKNWSSFHSYTPADYLSVGSRFYSINNNHQGIWRHHADQFGNFYGTVYPMEIAVAVNGDPALQKSFDNSVVQSNSYDEADRNFVPFDFFDELEVEGEYLNSGTVPLNISNPQNSVTDNVRFKRDGYQLFYPRNAVIDPALSIYEPTNIAPQDTPYLPRIKGKYAISRFRYRNDNNYRFSVNNILSLYRAVYR